MRRSNSIIASLLLAVIVSTTGSAQSRVEAEKAIRQATFETMKAFILADARSFKLRVTQRTIQLLSLAQDALRQDGRYSEELRRAGINNFDQFLEYIFRNLSPQFAALAPASPEKAAEKVASQSQISFINNSEAKILFNNAELARARLAGSRWQIDLTDMIKKILLEEITDPQMKAKIKNF
jgi:hypothetical protein